MPETLLPRQSSALRVLEILHWVGGSVDKNTPAVIAPALVDSTQGELTQLWVRSGRCPTKSGVHSSSRSNACITQSLDVNVQLNPIKIRRSCVSLLASYQFSEIPWPAICLRCHSDLISADNCVVLSSAVTVSDQGHPCATQRICNTIAPQAFVVDFRHDSCLYHFGCSIFQSTTVRQRTADHLRIRCE